jgi:hypothetical protein
MMLGGVDLSIQEPQLILDGTDRATPRPMTRAPSINFDPAQLMFVMDRA